MAQAVSISKKDRETLEWYESLVFALVFLLAVFSFFFRIIRVDGSSMVPTLRDGDRLIVWGAGYEPHNGDVIVMDGYIEYGKPLVKRIIAMGGDTIDIDYSTGTVTVNGVILQEPYIAEPTTLQGDVSLPMTVPDGQVFVMGDNRNGSKDSRRAEIGCLDKRDVLGKVIFRVAPFQKMGKIS